MSVAHIVRSRYNLLDERDSATFANTHAYGAGYVDLYRFVAHYARYGAEKAGKAFPYLGLVALVALKNKTAVAGAERIFEILDEQPEPVTVSDATGSTLAEDARQLEERLTEIIGQVAGAGETCVMVTMDTTRESVYAEDITSQRRSIQTGELGSGDEDFSEERTHVLLGNGSEESPLVEKRIEPTVRGVLILCEGAEDPVVEARVTEAVRTVLGISSSQICVEKISN